MPSHYDKKKEEALDRSFDEKAVDAFWEGAEVVRDFAVGENPDVPRTPDAMAQVRGTDNYKSVFAEATKLATGAPDDELATRLASFEEIPYASRIDSAPTLARYEALVAEQGRRGKLDESSTDVEKGDDHKGWRSTAASLSDEDLDERLEAKNVDLSPELRKIYEEERDTRNSGDDVRESPIDPSENPLYQQRELLQKAMKLYREQEA